MGEDQIKAGLVNALTAKDFTLSQQLMQQLKEFRTFFSALQLATSDLEACQLAKAYVKSYGVAALLSAQASDTGFTVMHIAVMNQHDDLVAFMLNHFKEEHKSPGLRLVDSDGNSPLHLACTAKRWGQVTCLVQAGFSVTLKNKQSEFPLLQLISNSSFSIESFNELYTLAKQTVGVTAALRVRFDRHVLQLAIEAGNFTLVAWVLQNCEFQACLLESFEGDIDSPVHAAIRLNAHKVNGECWNILDAVLDCALTQTPVEDERWSMVSDCLSEIDCDRVTERVAKKARILGVKRFNRELSQFSGHYQQNPSAAIERVIVICTQLVERGFETLTSAEEKALGAVFSFAVRNHIAELICPVSELIPGETFGIVVRLRLELLNVSKRGPRLEALFAAVNHSLFMNFAELTDTHILEQLLPQVMLAGDLKLLKHFLDRSLRFAEVPLVHDMTIVAHGIVHIRSCERTVKHLITYHAEALELKSPHQENVLHQAMRCLSVDAVTFLRDAQTSWFERAKLETNDRGETPYNVLQTVFGKLQSDLQLQEQLGILGLAERIVQIAQLMLMVNDKADVQPIGSALLKLYARHLEDAAAIDLIGHIRQFNKTVNSHIIFSELLTLALPYKQIERLIINGCVPVDLSADCLRLLIKNMLQERHDILDEAQIVSKANRYRKRILAQLSGHIKAMDKSELAEAIQFSQEHADGEFLELLDMPLKVVEAPEEKQNVDDEEAADQSAVVALQPEHKPQSCTIFAAAPAKVDFQFAIDEDCVFSSNSLPRKDERVIFERDDDLPVFIEINCTGDRMAVIHSLFEIVKKHQIQGVLIGGFALTIARFLYGFESELKLGGADLDFIATADQRARMLGKISRSSIRHATYNVKVGRVDPQRHERFDVLGLPNGIQVQVSATITKCQTRKMMAQEFVSQMRVRDMTLSCIGIDMLDDGRLRVIFPSRTAFLDFQTQSINLLLDSRQMQDEWVFRVCAMLCKDAEYKLPLEQKNIISSQLMKFRLNVFSGIHYFMKYVLRYGSSYINAMKSIERTDGNNLLDCIFCSKSFISSVSFKSAEFRNCMYHLDGMVRLVSNESELIQLTGVFLLLSIASIKAKISAEMTFSCDNVRRNIFQIVHGFIMNEFARMGVKFDLVMDDFVAHKLGQLNVIAQSIAAIFQAFFLGFSLQNTKLQTLLVYLNIAEASQPIGLRRLDILRDMSVLSSKQVMHARLWHHGASAAKPQECFFPADYRL